jgi:hypothetical protein
MKGKTFVSAAPKQKGPTKDLLQALKASIETKKVISESEVRK